MNKTLIVLVLLAFFSCTKKEPNILLIKQWHLTPSKITTNIAESKKLPQAQNQIDIYQKVKKLIDTDELDVLIVEGCEGEVDKSFKEAFNGWDYSSLKNEKSKNNYADIVAHIGLKTEAVYDDEILTVCGDNNQMIKEHNLAFSNLRAFWGYYARLVDFQKKGDIKKFDLYAKSLMKGKAGNPVKYALFKTKESLNKVEALVKSRNKSFIEKIIKYKDKRVAAVIGGIHIGDIGEALKSSEPTIYIPKGYPEKDVELIGAIRKVVDSL